MNDNLHKLPLYQKALELLQLTEALVTTISDEDPFLEATKGFMMEMHSLFRQRLQVQKVQGFMT